MPDIWEAVLDDHTCPTCAAANRTARDPSAECTSPLGCRCVARRQFDPASRLNRAALRKRVYAGRTFIDPRDDD